MKIQGFIPPEQIAPEEWVLGASNTPVFPVLKEDGNWEEYLPTEERQNIRNIETYNCTGFNTLNAIEILVYKLTGKRENYSDRWVGIIAKTKAPGNDPHKVAEAIRECGLVKEESLPFSDDIKDINEYYSFKGLTQGQIDALYEEAKQWKKTYDFKHSWVFTPGQPILEQINNIKIALKNSPLAVGVYAWASDNRNVYYSLGQENHWTNIYNVSDFIKVFDSYPPFKKDIEQTLRYCKRYSVTLRNEITAEQKKSLLSQLQKLLEWLGLIQKQVDALPKVDNSVEVKPQEVYNEVKEQLKTNMIEKWAKAIDKWEGNTFGNNPGNLKFSPLIEKFGGKKGKPGSDGGHFAVFDTYEQGFKALCSFLELGCKNQLKSYKNARTLGKFMKIYAGNPPENYIKGVAKELGVSLDVDIGTFL